MDDLLLLAEQSAYAEAVLADSPLIYLRLAEISGSVARDSSGGGHNGTYNGSPTLGHASLLDTDADTAVTFDGSDDYINITTITGLKPSHWTLEGWVNVDNAATLMGTFFCDQYNGSSVTYALGSFDGTNHSLKPSIGFYNGSWHTAQAGSSISKNARHHLVGTWDGTDLKIYVDGSLANTVTPGSSPSGGNTSEIRVGRRWDAGGDGQWFQGVLDEIALYDHDIGGTRVSAHYAAALGTVNGTATPSAVAGTGAVPAPTGKGNGTAAPEVVAGVGAVPAATTTGGGKATPAATAGTGAVPGPTVTGTAFATPSTVAGVGAVPAPTAFSIDPGVAAPDRVIGTAQVPGPTGLGIALVVPAQVASVGAVPASATTGTGFASPSTTDGTGAIPAATAGAIQNATVVPDTVAGIGAVPRARGVGQGTGGGGGSTNGVTDFWSVKALG